MPREAQIGLLTALIAAGLVAFVGNNLWIASGLVGAGSVWAMVLVWRDHQELLYQVQQAQPFYDQLGQTERLVLRTIYALGVQTELQANERVGAEQLVQRDVLTALKAKTPFVLGSFSGHFTPNERLRRAVEYLLKNFA